MLITAINPPLDLPWDSDKKKKLQLKVHDLISQEGVKAKASAGRLVQAVAGSQHSHDTLLLMKKRWEEIGELVQGDMLPACPA